MKKRIQKYLAGEREGFSLVELIIVIAIMAILIGVIALAVIPNIQRSRESKDLSTLDGVMSSLNVAFANTHDATALKTWADGSSKSLTNLIKADDNFAKNFKESFGTTEPSLTSGAADSAKINFIIKSATGAANITVQAGDGTKQCTYTDGDDGKKAFLKVSNGSSKASS